MDVEATTGFEPVNGGFANLWLTTCLRRQRFHCYAMGGPGSSPQMFDCLVDHCGATAQYGVLPPL